MNANTLEQRRATHALNRVRELEKKGDTFKKRYRAYVERFGPASVINGLGQTLCSELAAAGANPSKDDEMAHQALYKSIEGWLCSTGGDGIYPQKQKDLIDALVKGTEDQYLRAHQETLSWLVWHKKFCRAFFPRETGGDV